MSRMYDPNSSRGHTQLSARVPEDLKREFKNAADEQGETMTEAITKLMADYADHQRAEDTHTPDDPELARALDALERGANERGRIKADTARGLVAQALGVPKQATRRAVLRPLERAGYIEPFWGEILVCRVRARKRVERARQTDKSEKQE
jgi:antitoxin component of RelBE/YafQ-DinJ toxin-antitoxin module